MKYIFYLIETAIDDLKRNKGRTFLTSLGIMIGVLSVVLLIAFGVGLKNFIKNQFESLGTNLIIIFPGQVLQNGSFRSGAGASLSVRFDQRDLTKLKRIPEASLVAPVVSRALNVTGEGKTESSDLYSTTGDLFTLRNLKAEYGRVFDNKDVEKSAKIAVIGPKLAEKLFGSSQLALGKTIRMQSQRYLVEGILESKGGGGFGGPDFDSFVYVPYTAAYSINTDKKFFQFYIGARTEGDIPRLKQEVEKVLLSRYKSDDFSIIEQKEILNAVTTIFNVLNIVLIAIGSISLVVGGIGIMNIMYASVTERIKEIGIRRAIGATRRDVLLQFVSEAVIL